MLDAAKINELAEMTPQELADLLGPELDIYIQKMQKVEAAQRASKQLLTFMQYINPDPDAPDDITRSKYEVHALHKVLAEALEKVERGEMLRLALSVPPQMGKTAICTKGFPAWIAGKYPHRDTIIAAYNQNLAETFGTHIRRIIEGREFQEVFPKARLEGGVRSKKEMMFEDGGSINLIGRDGAGTGRSADLFIIDDPYKNKTDVDSLATREEVWSLYTRVVNSRMRNTGAVIVIHTRWSTDDLIARLTDPLNPYYNAEVAKDWTYINIPEIMDDEVVASILGKKVGDALWPERRSLKMLNTVRLMDPAGFSALHMGKPTPPEGAFFQVEHLHGYDHKQLPKNMRFYLAGDLAVSTKKTADKSAVGIWGIDSEPEPNLWLMPHLLWKRSATDETVEWIIDQAKQYGILTAYWEKGQIDNAVGPFLERRMMERVKKGEGQWFHLEKFPTTGDKGKRAQSFRSLCAQGRVKFPTFAPWWPAAKDHMLKFTGSGNDLEDDFADMCGIMGQAANQILRAHVPKATNVVSPKVGTLAWTRWASDADKRRRNMPGRIVRAF